MAINNEDRTPKLVSMEDAMRVLDKSIKMGERFNRIITISSLIFINILGLVLLGLYLYLNYGS